MYAAVVEPAVVVVAVGQAEVAGARRLVLGGVTAVGPTVVGMTAAARRRR